MIGWVAIGAICVLGWCAHPAAGAILTASLAAAILCGLADPRRGE